MLSQPRPDRLNHIPEALRASYEEAVDSQLRNHPFLSSSKSFVNPVFADFATATMVLDERAGARGREVESRARARQSQISSGLGPFVLALLGSRQEALRAGLVDLVVTSVSLRQDSHLRFSYEVEITQDEGRLVVDTNIDGAQQSRIVAAVDGAATALRLPDLVRDITVVTDREVEVRGRTLRLGPNVGIEAAMLSFTGDECHVDATGPVVLDAEFVLANWEQTLTLRGDGLQVFAEASEGWLQRYARPRPTIVQDDLQRDYYRSLRRLLRFFRRTQHVPAGYLAADREQLQVYILRTDEPAQRLLAALEESGDIVSSGREYRLNQRFLARMNMNFSDVESYTTTPQLWEYLKSVQELPRAAG